MNALLNFAVLLVLVTSVQLWILAIIRFAKSQPLVVAQPRRDILWGLSDILMAIILQMFVHSLGHEYFRRKYGLSERFELHQLGLERSSDYVMVMACASLAALAFTVVWLLIRHRASSEDFGVQFKKVGTDIVLGVQAFVMLAPIVYGIQFVLVQLIKSEHPLIEMLKKNPSPRFFVMSGFAAVIVAPLVEEFFFRVLLQGWFERLATGLDTTRQILFGGRRSVSHTVTETVITGSPFAEFQLDENPYQSGGATKEYKPPLVVQRKVRRWPIAASAFLFALAHAANGPDPVPLFVLALGLGYLYQTTNRILPSIIVHFLLNGTTLAIMWLVMREGK